MKGVVVVAMTDRPDSVDSALRRPGRLDRELAVPPPNRESRVEVLRCHTRGGAFAALQWGKDGAGELSFQNMYRYIWCAPFSQFDSLPLTYFLKGGTGGSDGAANTADALTLDRIARDQVSLFYLPLHFTRVLLTI